MPARLLPSNLPSLAWPGCSVPVSLVLGAVGRGVAVVVRVPDVDVVIGELVVLLVSGVVVAADVPVRRLDVACSLASTLGRNSEDSAYSLFIIIFIDSAS